MSGGKSRAGPNHQLLLDLQEKQNRFSPLNSGAITALGLGALCQEIESQGVDREALLSTIGLTPASLDDPLTQITPGQKIKFLENLKRMTQDQVIGLLAGQRHRLQDFGVYGLALSSFTTLEKAIRFGLSHAKFAGSIIEHRLHVDVEGAFIKGRDVFQLNSVLPLAADFCFSTMHRLISLIMPRPFRSLQLLLPFPAPSYAEVYGQIFECTVTFGAE